MSEKRIDTIANVIKYATSPDDLRRKVLGFIKRRCGKLGTKERVDKLLNSVLRGLKRSKSPLTAGILSDSGFVKGLTKSIRCSKALIGTKAKGYVRKETDGVRGKTKAIIQPGFEKPVPPDQATIKRMIEEQVAKMRGYTREDLKEDQMNSDHLGSKPSPKTPSPKTPGASKPEPKPKPPTSSNRRGSFENMMRQGFDCAVDAMVCPLENYGLEDSVVKGIRDKASQFREKLEKNIKDGKGVDYGDTIGSEDQQKVYKFLNQTALGELSTEKMAGIGQAAGIKYIQLGGTPESAAQSLLAGIESQLTTEMFQRGTKMTEDPNELKEVLRRSVYVANSAAMIFRDQVISNPLLATSLAALNAANWYYLNTEKEKGQTPPPPAVTFDRSSHNIDPIYDDGVGNPSSVFSDKEDTVDPKQKESLNKFRQKQDGRPSESDEHQQNAAYDEHYPGLRAMEDGATIAMAWRV